MRDLRGAHLDEAKNLMGNVLAAIVVALGVGAIGFFSYQDGWWTGQPKQAVLNSQLPSPTPPDVQTSPKIR